MESGKNIQLCPQCKTGRDSYLYDSKSPVCPYMGSHNGQSCSYFVEMNSAEDDKIVEKKREASDNG